METIVNWMLIISTSINATFLMWSFIYMKPTDLKNYYEISIVTTSSFTPCSIYRGITMKISSKILNQSTCTTLYRHKLVNCINRKHIICKFRQKTTEAIFSRQINSDHQAPAHREHYSQSTGTIEFHTEYKDLDMPYDALPGQPSLRPELTGSCTEEEYFTELYSCDSPRLWGCGLTHRLSGVPQPGWTDSLTHRLSGAPQPVWADSLTHMLCGLAVLTSADVTAKNKHSVPQGGRVMTLCTAGQQQ